MAKLFKRVRALILILALMLPISANAQTSKTRQILLSSTYGVIAGTMIGAATLAFSDKPSEHLYRVARGASLGLYAGLLLGLYVAYVIPNGDADDDKVASLGWNQNHQLNAEPLRARLPELRSQFELRPILSESSNFANSSDSDASSLSGASFHYSFHTF